MAVPKRKTTPSRRNQRRGSNGTYALKKRHVITDETTGEYKLPHHVSLDGYYKGRKVVEKKAKAEKKELAQ